MNKTQTDIKNILAEKKLDSDPLHWSEKLNHVTAADVERVLKNRPGIYSFDKLLTLISPAAESCLEQMAKLANQLTAQRFGKTIKLYAPLYVSNYCINSCLYCGFNKNSEFERTRITVDQALKDADIIASEGFKDILLVSGQDPNFITVDYLSKLAEKLRSKFSSISIEIYQLTRDQYKQLFEAGIDGVTIYQETYDRHTYRRFHPAGAKADYDQRLIAPDDIAQAGMRQIGLGALLGLTNWRFETLALAEHAHYLMKRYWQSQVSFSFPRLRPAYNVGSQQFKNILTDKNLVQMITALRLCFADAGLVLSTREGANLRDNLVNLGITKLSAGSKTNPGGYSACDQKSVEQFEVSDDRPAATICEMLKQKGLDPVWKDWDPAFNC